MTADQVAVGDHDALFFFAVARGDHALASLPFPACREGAADDRDLGAAKRLEVGARRDTDVLADMTQRTRPGDYGESSRNAEVAVLVENP